MPKVKRAATVGYIDGVTEEVEKCPVFLSRTLQLRDISEGRGGKQYEVS